MSKDLTLLLHQLDDYAIVRLLKHVGPMLFKDPQCRRLMDTETKSDLVIELSKLDRATKQQLLDSAESIRLARELLELLTSRPQFHDVMANALKTLPKDELAAEAKVPLGLITDSLRLLVCSYVPVERNIRGDREVSGPDAVPEVVHKIARQAISGDMREAAAEYRREAMESQVVFSAPMAGSVLPSFPGDEEQMTPELCGAPLVHAKPPEMMESVRATSTKACEVYPKIAVDDEHPICKTTVHFDVSLESIADPNTPGRVHIETPSPEQELEVQVHLMFGSASAWSILRWSQQRGTIRPASFDMVTDEIAGDRLLVGVRANFYLNKRWCGSGERNLDVRRDSFIEALSNIPLPDVPPWRANLTLEADALPSDLIVRIMKGNSPKEFVWVCLSPHLEFGPAEGSDRTWLEDEDAPAFVRNTFGSYANVKSLNDLEMDNIEGIGEEIYRITPPYFRDCYWSLWREAVSKGFVFDSVLIVTEESCVPWELMRLSDTVRAPDVKAELLAIRHSVGRWLARESASLRQNIEVKNVAVSSSTYENVAVNPKLPWVAGEHRLLRKTYEAEDVPLTSHDLKHFFEEGSAQALHLACHGQMLIKNANASVLVMEDNPQNLQARWIARREVYEGFGRQHPFVFLNACEMGATAESLSLVAGFPAAFLGAGASALISPLWEVNDEHAKEVAEEFYLNAFVEGEGKPLGVVLRDLRARWKQEQHLTFLAYVLYGDPMARVNYVGLIKKGDDDAGKI